MLHDHENVKQLLCTHEKRLPTKMSNELHLEGATHNTTPVKKGVYKELRANPYLLELSTVSGHLQHKIYSVLTGHQVRIS